MKKQEYYSVLEDISLIDKYDEKINIVRQLEEWFGKDCSLKDAEDALWFHKLEVTKRIENQLNVEQ